MSMRVSIRVRVCTRSCCETPKDGGEPWVIGRALATRLHLPPTRVDGKQRCSSNLVACATQMAKKRLHSPVKHRQVSTQTRKHER